GGFALGLMEALVAAGDRASALRHARAHERRVAQEIDTGPDTRIAALVQRLRAEAGPGSSIQPSAARRAASGRLPFAAALADRYAVERELGRGGTTTVYLARDCK